MLLYYNVTHDNYTAITAITVTILLYYTGTMLLHFTDAVLLYYTTILWQMGTILLCNGIPQLYHNILCYGAVVYKVWYSNIVVQEYSDV